MPSRPHTPSSYHLAESEQILSTLGSLGPDEAERIVEVLVALTHAVLSIAATLALPARDPRSDEQRFGQDFA